MTGLTILHILPRWNHGGGAQSILRESLFAKHHALPINHLAMPLEPGGSLSLQKQALRNRLRLYAAPDRLTERTLIARADVMVLHYWNTPSVRGFLDRWRGEELRWILYARINGLHPPQRLPERLVNTACHTILTSPHCLRMGNPRTTTVIPAIADIIEPCAINSARHTLLHSGTLNVFKIAPHFIDVHAALATYQRTMQIAGAGGDEARFQARAQQLKIDGHFEWLGFVNDPTALYQQAALFSYPSAPFTYASSDKVIQESQVNGCPVLLPRTSPVAHLIEDGVTGFLSENQDDYQTKLSRYLSGDLERLDPEAVSQAAQRMHHPDWKCQRLIEIYDAVLANGPSAVDDGYPELEGWLTFQVGDMALASQHRRPDLSTLMNSENALLAHQCWACEGGLAQYINANPAQLHHWMSLRSGGVTDDDQPNAP